MKSKLFVIFMFLSVILSAQKSAPTIKVNDIYGNFYNSTEILAEGKYIFIDFFTNSCSSCQYLAPFVDSAYQELGCNCGDVFYFAINIDENSTNSDVFNFAQQFGLQMPTVSAEGGGANVGDIYDVPYTPYFKLIAPNSDIVYDSSQFITSSQQWLDTLANYGILPAICKGTDIDYFEVKIDTTSYFGTIDKKNNEIYVQLPENTDVSNLNVFMINSAKSNVILNLDTINTDSSFVDLSDSLAMYKVVAEADTVFENWNVILQTLTDVSNVKTDIDFYYDMKNKQLHLLNMNEIKKLQIFDINGRIILNTKPTTDVQNFQFVPQGIYIVTIRTNDDLIFSKKIFVDK